jgi:DNA-binding transcriptional LysR family regulator
MDAQLPTPAELRYFLAVAENSNVSRAAERLGVRQPTLSLALQRLEHSVGAKLLERSKSGVRLTPAGRVLQGRARELLEVWESARAGVRKSLDEVAGRYVLGCHPSVALYSLPAVLDKVLRERTALEISLRHGLSREILEDVVSRRADFGLVINPVRSPDLVLRELAKDEVGFWKAPGAQEDLLIWDPELFQARSLVHEMEKKGRAFARTLSTANLEFAAHAAAAGVGIAILPARVARLHGAGKLKPLPAWPVFKDRLFLVYRPETLQSHGGRWLSKRLLEELAKHFA